MNKNLTEIIFILDRSGSMEGLAKDTIGGYNAFLDTQRKEPGEAKVTTVLFDDKYEVLHNGIALDQIRPITGKEYFARGSTALLDAIGKTINEVGERLSNTQESERPEKVIMVITTDGQENDSREFTYKKIKKMITHQQEKYNWEFLFLGANINAVEEARNLGIRDGRAAQYAASAVGTESLYSTVGTVVSGYRNSQKIDADWDKEIDPSDKKKIH